MEDHFGKDLSWSVLEWTLDGHYTLVAKASNFSVAAAAFDEACRQSPGRLIALQQGIRSIRQSPELRAIEDAKIAAMKAERAARVPTLWWQESKAKRGWAGKDVENRAIKAVAFPTRKTWPGEQWEWSVAEHSKILATGLAGTAEEARAQADRWYAGRRTRASTTRGGPSA